MLSYDVLKIVFGLLASGCAIFTILAGSHKTMKKRFFRFVLISAAAAFITGCSTDYDWSTDHVQIGCRYRTYESSAREVSFFRFGFPWWYDRNGHNILYGIDLCPFFICEGNLDGLGMDVGKLDGLGISLMSLRNNTVNGVIVAPLLSVQEKTNGASFSLINFSRDYSPGLQVGLVNCNSVLFSPRSGTWVQLALLNVADDAAVQLAVLNAATEAEVQLGVFNGCDSLKNDSECMLQIGLVNSSQNGILQLGLLNQNRRSCFCTWFPLFNFSRSIFD